MPAQFDGQRSDSRILQIRFLFDEIEVGLRFVRSAGKISDLAVRARTLSFAQKSHNVAQRLMQHAPLTGKERIRLKTGLRALQKAIDNSLE